MLEAIAAAEIDDADALPVAIATRLARDGWVVVDDFLDAGEWHTLAMACRQRAAAGELRAAGVGRGDTHHHEPALRGDRTRWLDANSGNAIEAQLLARLHALGTALNRHAYLGVAEVEAHYAHYPPGANYGVHRDRFRDDDARVLSLVAYLNENWRADDGGALRLYLDAQRQQRVDIAPQGGRLVVFLSADFEHEVRAATRDRYSVAAWLRRRDGA